MATMQSNLRPVDPTIWRACAGNSVQIPAVGSRAYYFPQGHAHYLSLNIQSHRFILCRVMGVDYMADTDTDEILAKIQLIPIHPQHDESTRYEFLSERTRSEFVSESTGFTSVVKVLTPSDANNGGGFSVPKSCADLVFPPLDFTADPPVQTLRVKDVLGVAREFRHIYRGTPRRHLLTTGWSKFVNCKKLVAGDSAVFMKSRRSGQIFVGIRRAAKAANVGSGGRWNYLEVEEGEEKVVCGKTAAEIVEEATELAVKGVGFEIVYYPKVDASDFVVKAEKVERSILGVSWMVGTRVKMAVETEDLSRITWIQGTVSKVNDGASQNSPWHMLQVTWDDLDVVKNMTNVSPWQVEYVAALPEHSEFPAAKKCRISEDAGLPLHGDGELIPAAKKCRISEDAGLPLHGYGELIPGKCKIPEDVGLLPHGNGELFPVTWSSNSVAEHFNPLLMKCNSYPAGMQEARQDQIYVSGVSNYTHEITHQNCSSYIVSNMSPMEEPVSTELNIGNTELSNLPAEADSSKDVQFFGNEVVGTRVCTASPKVGISSIQLFGKIIYMN